MTFDIVITLSFSIIMVYVKFGVWLNDIKTT